MINKYPDGSSYAEVLKTFDGSVFRINSYEDLWHLHQSVDAFVHKFNYAPRVIIPNLIDAQADRRFAENQSHGLKLVCNFLCNMTAFFEIFHPHNAEVVESLIPNCKIIDNSEFVLEALRGVSQNDVILLSADAGGFKPLMKLCENINWQGETASASKARMHDGTIEQVLPELTSGKDIYIVDDICIYGGTFKGLATLIRKMDPKCSINLIVSHMTVANLGVNPITNYFDEVYTTDSKFEDGYYSISMNDYGEDFIHDQPDNLNIIKLWT